MKRKLNYNVILGTFLIALMVFLFHVSNSFVYAESTALFPKITIVIIGLLSTIVLIDGILKTIRGSEEDAEKEPPIPFLKKYGKPLLVYGVFILYLLVFYFVNFFVATALMLVGLMLYFGVRNWKPLVFVPTGFLLVTYFVFVRLLGVNLL